MAFSPDIYAVNRERTFLYTEGLHFCLYRLRVRLVPVNDDDLVDLYTGICDFKKLLEDELEKRAVESEKMFSHHVL